MRDRLIHAAAAFLMPADQVAGFSVGEFDGSVISYIDYGPVSVSGLVDAVLNELRKPLDSNADAGALILGNAQLPEHDEPMQEDAQNCFTAMIDAIRDQL